MVREKMEKMFLMFVTFMHAHFWKAPTCIPCSLLDLRLFKNIRQFTRFKIIQKY
jgi:hypothetical protein